MRALKHGVAEDLKQLVSYYPASYLPNCLPTFLGVTFPAPSFNISFSYIFRLLVVGPPKFTRTEVILKTLFYPKFRLSFLLYLSLKLY